MRPLLFCDPGYDATPFVIAAAVLVQILRIELVLHAIEASHQHRGEAGIGIIGQRIGETHLDALGQPQMP
jgi:hypothetical protein